MPWWGWLLIVVAIVVVVAIIFIPGPSTTAWADEEIERISQKYETRDNPFIPEPRRATVEIEDFGESFGEFRFRYQVIMSADDFKAVQDEVEIEPVKDEALPKIGRFEAKGPYGSLYLVFAGTGETQTQALEEALSALAIAHPERVAITYVTY